MRPAVAVAHAFDYAVAQRLYGAIRRATRALVSGLPLDQNQIDALGKLRKKSSATAVPKVLPPAGALVMK